MVNDSGILQPGFAYLAVSTGNRTANYTLQIAAFGEGYTEVCSQITTGLQEFLQTIYNQTAYCGVPAFLLDTSPVYPGCPDSSCLTGTGNCRDSCTCLQYTLNSLEQDGFANDFAMAKQVCPQLVNSFGTCPMSRYTEFVSRCGLSPRFDALINSSSLPSDLCAAATTLVGWNQTVQGSTDGSVISSSSPCDAGTGHLAWYRINVTTGGTYRIRVASPIVNVSVFLYVNHNDSCAGLTCLSPYGFVDETGVLPAGPAFLAVSTGNVTGPFTLTLAENGTGYDPVCANFTQQFQWTLDSLVLSDTACLAPNFLLDTVNYTACPDASCLSAPTAGCINPCPCLELVVSFLELVASELSYVVQMCGPLPSIGTCAIDQYRQFTTHCQLTPRLDAVLATLNPNVGCQQATRIQVSASGNATLSGSTVGQSSATIRACEYQQHYNSPAIWYTFSVNETMLYTFEVVDASFDTVMHLLGDYYLTGACTSPFCSGSNDDIAENNQRSRVTAYLSPSYNYYLVIQGYSSGDSGSFAVRGYPGGWSEPRPGDSCAAALEIYPGLMVAAETYTRNLQPIGPCANLTGRVIWYKVVVTNDNVYTIELGNYSTPEVQLALYSSSFGGCTQLSCVRMTVGSSITFEGIVDQSYYLAVSTGMDYMGTVNFTITGQEDLGSCTNAPPYTLSPFDDTYLSGSNSEAEYFNVLPCVPAFPSRTSWFKLSIEEPGYISFEVVDTAIAAVVHVLESDDGMCDKVACLDTGSTVANTTASAFLQPGKAYFLGVRGYGDDAGAFTIRATRLISSNGTSCDTAINVTDIVLYSDSSSVLVNGSTTTAVQQTLYCDMLDTAPVTGYANWYSATIPVTGNYTVSVANATAGRDVRVYIYLRIGFGGTCASNLGCLADNSVRGPQVGLLNAGSTIFIVVVTLDEFGEPAMSDYSINMTAPSTSDILGSCDATPTTYFDPTTELNLFGDNYNSPNASLSALCTQYGAASNVYTTWYKFVFPRTMNIVFEITSATFDTVLHLLGSYDGRCRSVFCIASNDDTYGQRAALNVTVEPYYTYHLAVQGYSGLSGSYALHITAPGNTQAADLGTCSDAMYYALGDMSTFTVSGSNVGAPLARISRCRTFGSVPSEGSATMWFHFSVSTAGWYEIEGMTATFDMVLHLLESPSGTCDSSACLADDDDNGVGNLSLIQAYLAPDYAYFLAVQGYSGAYGEFTIQIRRQGIQHDGYSCQTALPFVWGVYPFALELQGTTYGSPASELMCASNYLEGLTTWYTANVTFTGNYSIALLSASPTEVNFTVYSGYSCEQMACMVDGHEDPYVTQSGELQEGMSVFIAVVSPFFGESDESGTDFVLRMTAPERMPGNDTGSCGSAQPLDLTGDELIYSNNYYEPSTNLQLCYLQQIAATAWYKFNVSEPMVITLEITSATFDTVITLLGSRDQTCGSLYCVGLNDDYHQGEGEGEGGSRLSRLDAEVYPGIEYYIGVFGFQNATGEFTLSVGASNFSDCLEGACACADNITAGTLLWGQTYNLLAQTIRCNGEEISGQVNAKWYVLNATEGGEYTFQLPNAYVYNISLTVFLSDGGDCSESVCWPSLDPNPFAPQTLSVREGEIVYLAVATPVQQGGGSFQLRVFGPGEPTGYRCSAALNISVGATVQASFTGFPNASLSCGLEQLPALPTAWYVANITESGDYIIQAIANYPQVVYAFLFVGDCDQLTCIGDNRANLYGPQRRYLQRGTTVHIAVLGSEGSYQLTLAAPSNASGADCANARTIWGDGTVTGNLLAQPAAQLTCGDLVLPGPLDILNNRVMWYVTNITHPGNYTIKLDSWQTAPVRIVTYASYSSNELRLEERTGCEALYCMSSGNVTDPLEPQTFYLSKGMTVRFVLMGNARSSYVVSWTGPEVEDGCVGQPVTSYYTGQPVVVEGSNYNGVPSRVRQCTSLGAHDAYPTAWYKVEVMVPTVMKFEILNATFDTVMHLLRAAEYTDCTALTCVASNDDSCGCLLSRLEVPLEPYIIYAVAIQGYAGEVGNFTLSISDVNGNQNATIYCPQPAEFFLPPNVQGVSCGAAAYYNTCPPEVDDWLQSFQVMQNSPSSNDTKDSIMSPPGQVPRGFFVSYSPGSFQVGTSSNVTMELRDSSTGDSVSRCTVNLTLSRPPPEVIALEVNQVVQDWSHSIELVVGKATVVRVFVQLPDGDNRNSTVLVDGTLSGAKYGMPLMDSPLQKTSLHRTIEVTTGIQERRGDVRASFNFYLPVTWTAEGPATFCFLPVQENGSRVLCREQDGDKDCCISVVFVVKNPPCLRFVKVFFREDNEIKAVTDQVLREQYRRFRSMLPSPSDFPAQFVQFDFVYESRPPLRTVNNALDAARVLDDLAARQTRVAYKGLRCWYIGVLKGIGGGLADKNGETAAYYVGRAEATMSCGYDRNRGIHEFAHCMGVEHTAYEDTDGKSKTSCSQVENDAALFPYNNYLVPGDPLSMRPTLGPMGDEMTEVWGVDPHLVGAGGPSYLVHVTPRAVFSLLSYCQQASIFGCQGRFMDKNTYSTMSTRLSARAVLGPQELGSDTPKDLSLFRGTIAITGGEITVTLGPLLEVCAKDNAETKANSGSVSGLSVTVRDGVTNPKVNITTPEVNADMIADLLGCSNSSNSSNPLCAKQLPFSHNSQDGWPYFSFDGFPAFSFDAFTFGSFDGFTFGSFDAFPMFSFDGFTYFSFDGFPFLSFDGFPISELPNGLRVGNMTSKGFTLPFIDFEGFNLTFPPVINDFQGVPGATPGGAPNGTKIMDFTVAMPSVLKATQGQVLPQSGPGSITISVDFDLQQKNLLRLTLSAHAPEFAATNPVYKPALVGGQKPVFDQTTPKIDVCWAVRDVDGQSLTISIQFCPDFASRGVGCSCETLLLEYVDPSPAPCAGNPMFNCSCVSFDKARLRASADARFRVYASDGLRAADALSIEFEVANNPPNVQIVSPQSNMTKIVPSRLSLLGTADDVEDITVPDWACQWVVSKNGTSFAYYMGAGKELSVSTQTIRFNSQHLVPLVNCRATYDFEFSCSDAASARGVETASVVLYQDEEPPMLFCPTAPGARLARPGECVSGVSFEDPTAKDNCGGPVDIQRVLGGPSGSDFPVGTTLVRYRATDQFTRNMAECTIPVVVLDTEPPALTCPGDMEVGENEPVVYNWPNATDNCGGSLPAAAQPGMPPSGSVFASGVTLVRFSAIDASGNVGTCSMRVRRCSALLAGTVAVEQAITIVARRELASNELHLLEQQIIALTGLGDLKGCAVQATRLGTEPGPGVQRTRVLVRVFGSSPAQVQANLGSVRQVVETGQLIEATFPDEPDIIEIIIGDEPVGAKSDPHFVAGNGLKFDFMGEPGATYCLISDELLHVNMRMVGVSNKRPASATPAPARAATWIRSLSVMFWPYYNVTIDAASPEGTPFTAAHGTVVVNGKQMAGGADKKSSTMARWHGLTVTRRKTRITVEINALLSMEVEVVRASFWKGEGGPGTNFLNFKVRKMSVTDGVHGLLGQTFRSDFNVTQVEKKSKNGEGVIQGKPRDYKTSDLLDAAGCAKFTRFFGVTRGWQQDAKRMGLDLHASQQLRAWEGNAGGDSMDESDGPLSEM